MPICRKCENRFPNTKKIDGKKRYLNSRKFCLDCSPFGSRNTKPDDPSKKSYRKVEDGVRCPYSEWSDEAKLDFKARLYWKAKNRKEKLVNKFGGECEACGYSECMRALTFHHKDPTEKKFGLDKRTIQGMNWKQVLDEAAKCKLLCIRCHMEVEEKLFESEYEVYRDKFGHLGKK